MNNTIFPTFEEIEKGYQVFSAQGKYKGLDDYGSPIFSKPLHLNLILAHNIFDKYITIKILLNKKYKRMSFKYGYSDRFYSREFEYSEQGYKDLLKEIEKTLKSNIEAINHILGVKNK